MDGRREKNIVRQERTKEDVEMEEKHIDESAAAAAALPSWSSKPRVKKLSPPPPRFEEEETDEDEPMEDVSERKSKVESKQHSRSAAAASSSASVSTTAVPMEEDSDDVEPPRPKFALESRPPARLLAAAAASSSGRKRAPLSATPESGAVRSRWGRRKRSRSPSGSPDRFTSAAVTAPGVKDGTRPGSLSVLDRLAKHEAAARAASVSAAGAPIVPPLVLHDGSLTDNQASGLLAQVPEAISQRLRSYQREGVEWLFARWKANHGGVLADEMGLGSVTSKRCGASEGVEC